jgi:tRNA(Ile)-lysidine synthase
MGSLRAVFKRHLTLHFPELLEGRSVLALSGGIDSVVLCELLLDAEVDFSVAHCNFQLRGSESDADEKFVEEKARSLELEVHLKKFETQDYAREHGLSIQLAARELRYQWFDEILDKTHSDYLITAHHADDNLETFLINLSRGSGLKGLTGIPERNGRIRRPLLPFQREEVEAFARLKNISWREDRSNARSEYLRNRIRNELLPLMKETIPNLSTGFSSTLEHLKESQFILNDRIAEIWKEITASQGDLIEIDIAGIESLSHPKAYLYGLFSEFGFTQWTDIKELLTAQSGKMVFSSTHRLLKDRDCLLLQEIDSLPDTEQNQIIRAGQESAELSSGTLRLHLKAAADEEVVNTKNVASFDADKLIFPLTVRKWQKGDYFYPKGMRGRKKLSKFFKDEKLSIPEKENIWLLCAENEVAWIVGFRSDERFKVTEETKSVLHVEWIPK